MPLHPSPTAARGSAALVAALVLGILGLGAWTTSSTAVSHAGEAQTEAFHGTVEKIKQRRNTWTFEVTMSVEQVYGEAKLRAERVRVVLTPKYTRNCGVTPGRRQRPRKPAGFKPTFAVGDDVVVVADRLAATRYSVSSCLIGSAENAQLVESVIAEYGEPRAPRMPIGEEEDDLPEVSYSCVDTDEAITGDVAGADCASAEEGPTLTRSAAPGAAMVLAGLLGLFLVRRFRRRR